MNIVIFTILIISSLIFTNDISGVTYFNYSYDTGFGIKRTYFTYKKQISDELSFKFQTDVGQPEGNSGDDADDRWWGYLKKAQLDWKVSDDMKVSMGLIGMNMFNVQEKTWGNRFVEKTALDYAGWGVAAADMGIGFSKSFGNIASSLFLTNGEGYKNSNVDNHQKLSLQILHGEKRLDKNSGYNVGLVYSVMLEENHSSVSGVFGGWSTGSFVAGFEYYNRGDSFFVNYDSSLISLSMNYDVSDIVNEIKGQVRKNDYLSFFVRIDSFDDAQNPEDVDITMAGFIWSPVEGLDICPNITQVSNEDEVFAVNFQFKF